MTSHTGQALYTREFGNRPLMVLGGAIVVAALVTVLAFTSGFIFIIGAAVLVVAAGVAGFLTATTHLEVAPGSAVCRSRLRERSYDAADLTLERRTGSNVFVLAPREHSHKVVCTFSDDDVEHVNASFTAAGVTVVEPPPPPAESPSGDAA